MNPQQAFDSAFRQGRLIFFVGAGASFESHVPTPQAVLERSAELFLPAGRAYAADRRRLFAPARIAGTIFPSIQPELFYEHLLAIRPEESLLSLWRIMSRSWLAGQGAALRPNANHLAIVRYAAAHRLPVFTVNFDTLLEQAAHQVAMAPGLEAILPRSEEEKSAIARHGLPQGPAAPCPLFKLHGSIETGGRLTLGSLQTTMQAITASNLPMLALLRALARDRHLAFVGYSGRDIDYFPALASAPGLRRPFWFHPFPEPTTVRNVARIGATEIGELPSDIFKRLDPGLSALPPHPGVDEHRLFQVLKNDVPIALGRAEKILLLALCLHSVGENARAASVLARHRDALATALEPPQWAAALLLMARLEDCLSRWDRSLSLAEAALASVAGSKARQAIAQPERAALQIRARYQIALVRLQQLGPYIAFGDPRLDSRPSLVAALTWALRSTVLVLRLRLTARLWRGSSVMVRAEHAINDLWCSVLAIPAAAASRLAPAPGRALLRLPFRHLQRAAERSGDYFSYAAARKWLHWAGEEKAPADDTYLLLRDPLNYALVQRDDALRLMKEGKARKAATALRRARDAALRCGSLATALKAIVGLQAWRCASATDRRRLAALCPKIEGSGYRRYIDTRLAQLTGRVP